MFGKKKAIKKVTYDNQDFSEVSQAKLIWRSFMKNKLAVVGFVVIIIFYFIALFCEFLSPYDPQTYSSKNIYHPPHRIRLIDKDENGKTHLRLYVYKMTMTRDPKTLKTTYVETDEKIYLKFFAHGDPYRMWGFIDGDIHLFTSADPEQRVFFMGADRLGRDVYSRTLTATRISMTVGLIGVITSLMIGIILGGIAGFFGGFVDAAIQRVVEFLLAIPTIPLWLGLSAAMPREWSGATRYFAITVILALVGWTKLEREVRGRILALKTEDFVSSAILDGGSQSRIIFRHIVPSITSHIIAAVTLAIPTMIISETSLSFLGVGLLPPTISWGVLLLEVQNLTSLISGPWLFFPAVFVIVVVLAFNFMGDGLRDAADPYVFMRR